MRKEALGANAIQDFNSTLTKLLALVILHQEALFCDKLRSILTDINECTANTDGCGQICTNTDGSFMCSCNSGFALNNDARTCSGKRTLNYTIV